MFSASMCDVCVVSLATSLRCLSSVTVDVKDPDLHNVMDLVPLGRTRSWSPAAGVAASPCSARLLPLASIANKKQLHNCLLSYSCACHLAIQLDCCPFNIREKHSKAHRTGVSQWTSCSGFHTGLLLHLRCFATHPLD